MVQVSPFVSAGPEQVGLESPWGCGRSISAAPAVKQRNTAQSECPGAHVSACCQR